MYKHHQESIQNLVEYFKDDKDIIAVVLAGSAAKGCERADSDIDAIVIVTDEKYRELAAANRLTECVFGHCTYENGYFDVKYTTLDYLRALDERGSEPARNAFKSSVIILGDNKDVTELINRIPVFQKREKDEKMLSFYSNLALSSGYFWHAAKDNTYLRIRAASDIVLYGLRLLLQNNEVLFTCHKALLETVAKLESKPDGIVERADSFLNNLTDDSKNEFVDSILGFIDYAPPGDYAEILTRYTVDNELWWYLGRPNIAEW